MVIHQTYNETPFAVSIAPSQDGNGRELAVAVLKATYLFDEAGRLSAAPAEAQVPVFTADVPWGDPASTSLRYASDISPVRPGTGVAIVGHAYGRGKTKIQAGFRLGALEKILSVQGPRAWVGGFPVGIAGPVAFERLPLRYEHAFGGACEEPGRGLVHWPDNPVGVGFARAVVDRAPLPSIEYPKERYRSVKDRPAAAGLGFIPPGWRQRARLAGTFDEVWQRTRHPLLPTDLDIRFWNTVPQDQVLHQNLQGGERLVLIALHPRAETVILTMPRNAFTATFQVRDKETALPMLPDTVMVEPDEGRLAISYRAILAVGDDLRRLLTVSFRALEARPSRG